MVPGRHVPDRPVSIRSDQEQFFLGTGNRHIEKTYFFRFHVMVFFPCEDFIGSRFPAQAPLRNLVAQTQTQLFIQLHPFSGSALQSLVQPQAEYHRELKTLGFVHGHDPDQVIIISQSRSGLHFTAGCLLRKEIQEIPQTVYSMIRSLFRLKTEASEVLFGSISVIRRSVNCAQERILQQIPEKI